MSKDDPLMQSRHTGATRLSCLNVAAACIAVAALGYTIAIAGTMAYVLFFYGIGDGCWLMLVRIGWSIAWIWLMAWLARSTARGENLPAVAGITGLPIPGALAFTIMGASMGIPVWIVCGTAVQAALLGTACVLVIVRLLRLRKQAAAS